MIQSFSHRPRQGAVRREWWIHFQGLQRSIGRCGKLPAGQPGSGHLCCCARSN